MRVIALLLALFLSAPAFGAAVSVGQMDYPSTLVYTTDSAQTLGAMTIDASGEKAAAIFRAPKTGNIRKVLWKTSTTTTGDTVDVRLETVSTTDGLPTGTLVGTDTNGSHVVEDTDDNAVLTTTLTADAAVTAGDVIAVVIVQGSSGNMQVRTMRLFGVGTGGFSSFPYSAVYTTSWSKNINAMMFALEYDDGSEAYVYGAPPFQSVSTQGFATNTTPDVGGLRFVSPIGGKVAGAKLYVDIDTTDDCKVMLVSNAYHQANQTGILAQATIDGDRLGTQSTYYTTVMFDAPYTISANTEYRLIVEPTTTNQLTLVVGQFFSADHQSVTGGGSDFMYTTAKDPTGDGDWTDDNTYIPFMSLIFTEVEVGGGGSFAF